MDWIFNADTTYKTNNIKNTYKGKTYNGIGIDLENKIIKLPKLKEAKIRGYRNKDDIKGEIKKYMKEELNELQTS